MLPRRNNNSPEVLSTGDFEAVEDAPPPRRDGAGRAPKPAPSRKMSATIPPPPQSPLANARKLRHQQSPHSFTPSQPPQSYSPQGFAPQGFAPQGFAPQPPQPLPISQRALPGARPVYQQRLTTPVPQNEAELQRFLAQFDASGAHRPSSPPTSPMMPMSRVQPARVHHEPQQRLAAPFARTATPVIPQATASATSSLAPVALDDTGAQSIITNPTFVIPPSRPGMPWAMFMVAMGALVGVFVSMAVMKYRADKIAAASQPSMPQTQSMPSMPVANTGMMQQQPTMGLAMMPQPGTQPTQATQAPPMFTTSLRPPTPTTTATATAPASPPASASPSASSTSTSTQNRGSNAGSKTLRKPPVAAPPPPHHVVKPPVAAPPSAPSTPTTTTTTTTTTRTGKGESPEQMLQAAKRETGNTLE